MMFPPLKDLLTLVPERVHDHAKNEFSFDFQYYLDRIDRLQLSGGSVLDAGCGMGQWSAALSTKFERVSAFDYADYMVSCTKELMKMMNISNVDVKQADITATLPYENNSFDAVFCYGVIQLANSPNLLQKVFSEFYRILNPKGKVYVCLNDIGFALQNLEMPEYAAFGRMWVYNTIWKRFEHNLAFENAIVLTQRYLDENWKLHLINDYDLYKNGLPVSVENEYRRAYSYKEVEAVATQEGFTNFLANVESCLICEGADPMLKLKPKYVGHYKNHIAVWECVFEKPDISKQKVIIFGLGVSSKRVFDTLKSRCDIMAFVAKDSSLWGKERSGVQIISPDDILKTIGDDGTVVFCDKNYQEAYESVKHLGVTFAVYNKIDNTVDVIPSINNEKDNDRKAIKLDFEVPIHFSTEANSIVRKFPFPYNAMVAISSDIDYASTKSFEDMHKFLNTFEASPFGNGVGLDIGDSFFIFNVSFDDVSEGQLSWVHGLDHEKIKDAELIKKYWNAGWIDSIHSFGDFTIKDGEPCFNRSFAEKGWELLNNAGIAPTVWIDHGGKSNTQNFGSNLFEQPQEADNPSSAAYHTDITLKSSVRFAAESSILLGRSDIFGHDIPMEIKTLEDAGDIWLFKRYCNIATNIGEPVNFLWFPNMLRHQITAEKLDELERKNQYSILAQHLMLPDKKPEAEDIAAIRMLAERFHKRRTILVARTSRLLAYAVAQRYLEYQFYKLSDEECAIRITAVNDPVTGRRVPTLDELKGITFYVDNPEKTVVLLEGEQITNLQQNGKDSTGRKSVSIPWWEQDTFDYTSV